MRYIPATEQDRREMLAAIGASSVEDLFADIPDCARVASPLDLPDPVPEWDLLRRLQELCRDDLDSTGAACFLGAGAYKHFIPSVVDHLSSRSEFATAYTPYQPEVSQGTLQAIFEFQTMICQLTGMEVANASMYDGASALAEAVLMAGRVSRRKRILLSRGVHPRYRQVVRTYAQHLGLELVLAPLDEQGRTDHEQLSSLVDGDLAAVVVQSPNYLGQVEELEQMAGLTEGGKACLVAVVAEPLSLGLLKSPGELGVDIVCGEAQSFGNPLSFGGPYLGFFATRMRLVRSMPGRVAGETVDQDGRRGYVLTLSTREQHIRRAKATSNICTNQGLMALRSAIYMSAMGRQGLRELAVLNARKAEHLLGLLQAIQGVEPVFPGPRFNEFALRLPIPVARFRQACLKVGILAGIDLEPDYSELAGCTLLAATECNSVHEMETLAGVLEQEVGA